MEKFNLNYSLFYENIILLHLPTNVHYFIPLKIYKMILLEKNINRLNELPEKEEVECFMLSSDLQKTTADSHYIPVSELKGYITVDDDFKRSFIQSCDF